jgi:hypothetical protein
MCVLIMYQPIFHTPTFNISLFIDIKLAYSFCTASMLYYIPQNYDQENVHIFIRYVGCP